MEQEVAKRVDVALREVISNLVVANTELKVRVELLTAVLDERKKTDEAKVKSPLKAVQD